jgi:hypothetical protein
MSNRIDLNVASDRKKWAWSNTLRCAMDMPDKESIKRVIIAALADGWTMETPLLEGPSGLKGVPCALPSLAASLGAWRHEERSPLVEALSDLGVDWTRSWSPGQGSALSEAIKYRNWTAALSMMERGASLLADPNHADQSSPELIEEVWGSLQKEAWISSKSKQDERGGMDTQVRHQAEQAVLALSKRQLAEAFAQGKAKPEAWLPRLALAMGRSVLQNNLGQRDMRGLKAMKEFCAWAKAWGCKDWTGPLAPHGDPVGAWARDWELDGVKDLTLGLSLARSGVSVSGLWAQFLGDKNVSLPLDERSLWALVEDGGQICLGAQDWEELAAAGKSVAKGLDELSPWSQKIMETKAIPTSAHAVSAQAVKDSYATWAKLCVAMCAPDGERFADERIDALAKGRKSEAFGKAQEQAASNVSVAMAWARMDPSHAQWVRFTEAFGSQYAQKVWSAMLGAKEKNDDDVDIDNASSQNIVLTGRCAIIALSRLAKKNGRAGQELASSSLSRLAVMASDKLNGSDSDHFWIFAISKFCQQVSELASDHGAQDLGRQSWSALCAKACLATSEAIKNADVDMREGDRDDGLGASLSRLERAQMGLDLGSQAHEEKSKPKRI